MLFRSQRSGASSPRRVLALGDASAGRHSRILHSLSAHDARFARVKQPGQVMDRGMWAWSRHPNYFGELCFWWAVWLFGVSANPDSWWWTLIGPLTMTGLLRGASTPMMDKRSIERRPGYEDVVRKLPAMAPIGRRLFVRGSSSRP